MGKLPNNQSSGQAVLIILLVMAVILTIGLSVVSRSVTDINISQQSEDSARAFSAAEAGIEQALLLGTNGGFELGTGTRVDFNTREVAQGNTWYIYPSKVSTDQVVTVWLADYNKTGTCPGEAYCAAYTGPDLKVYWGDPGTPNNSANTPAIEASIYYKDSAEYKVGKYIVDPHPSRPGQTERGDCYYTYDPDIIATRCVGVTNFNNSGGNSISQATPPQDFQFTATLSLTNFISLPNKFPLFARIRLLYGTNISHSVGATIPSGSFPTQGKDITAVGTANNATRRVNVFRPKPAPPAIFDFAMYSGTNLQHQ